MTTTREERFQLMLAGRERARARGARLGGRPPYGWRSERGQLIPVPKEQAVRWLILHLARGGRSLQQIADVLAELGIGTRTGQRWNRSAVYGVTQRAAGEDAEQEGTG